MISRVSRPDCDMTGPFRQLGWSSAAPAATLAVAAPGDNGNGAAERTADETYPITCCTCRAGHVTGCLLKCGKWQPAAGDQRCVGWGAQLRRRRFRDRKSTRLNSSHVAISYAVVCL